MVDRPQKPLHDLPPFDHGLPHKKNCLPTVYAALPSLRKVQMRNESARQRPIFPNQIDFMRCIALLFILVNWLLLPISLAGIPAVGAIEARNLEMFNVRIIRYEIDGRSYTFCGRGCSRMVFDLLEIEVISPARLSGRRASISVHSNKHIWRKVVGNVRFRANPSMFDSKSSDTYGDGLMIDVFFESVGRYLTDVAWEQK